MINHGVFWFNLIFGYTYADAQSPFGPIQAWPENCAKHRRITSHGSPSEMLEDAL